MVVSLSFIIVHGGFVIHSYNAISYAIIDAKHRLSVGLCLSLLL